MNLTVRLAAAADAEAAIALDPRRINNIRQGCSGDGGRQAYVAHLENRLAGFALVGDLLGHPFLEQLRTAEDLLRQGVATALLDEIEARLLADRFFVSTNESNTAMRTLLAAREYKVSGLVENLDPGDPELFFVKFAPATPPA